MTLYGIQNEEKKWMLIMSPEGYFFTPTIPYRQLMETQKAANQVAVKLSRRKPEYRDKLTIVPVVLSSGDDIEVEYPPEKEE